MMLPRLNPGDGIGLVAPAEKVVPTDIANGVDILKNWGYRIKEGRHLYGEYRYFSGTMAERAADINEFLADPRIHAIYAVRGGVGSAQLLPELNLSRWKQNRKLLIGFSDLTALEWGLWAKTGLASISGMTLTSQLHRGNPFLEMFREVLQGKRRQVAAPDLAAASPRVIRPGAASGILLGGTLSMINSLLGTPYFPRIDQPVILFIEDIKEPLYRIERHLVQLQMAGFLEKVAGLILGRFLVGDHQFTPVPPLEYLFPPEIPIVADFPYGHYADSCPLPVGVPAELDTEPFRLRWKTD